MKKNWFKMIWLNSEERAILRAGLEKKDAPVETVIPKTEPEPVKEYEGRPYKNIFYSNGNKSL